MRKIESAAAKKKREKRLSFIVSMILLGILVLSTVGFAFSSTLGFGSSEEQGQEPQPGINEQNIPQALSYPEYQTETIPVSTIFTKQDFAGETLYLDSDSELVRTDIIIALGDYVPRIQRACYGSCEENVPEKTDCKDNMIVMLEPSNSEGEGKVYQEESCIFIEGGLKALDAFLYSLE